MPEEDATHHGRGDMVDPEILRRARELRTRQTPPELLLWNCLRDGRLGGFKFRRQHPYDGYILDFYCHRARLVVELDGMSHEGRDEHDRRRDAHLLGSGLEVMHVLNRELSGNLEGVLLAILRRARGRGG